MAQKVGDRKCVQIRFSSSDERKTLVINPPVNVNLFRLGKNKAGKVERWVAPFKCFAQGTVGF